MNETLLLPPPPTQASFEHWSVWKGLLNVIDLKTEKIVPGVKYVDLDEGYVIVDSHSLEPPKILYDEPPRDVRLEGQYRIEWNDAAKMAWESLRHRSQQEKFSPTRLYITTSFLAWVSSKLALYADYRHIDALQRGDGVEDLLVLHAVREALRL
jgi:hypothetical protein